MTDTVTVTALQPPDAYRTMQPVSPSDRGCSFISKVDHWNKIGKLVEYVGFRFVGRMTGLDGLNEVADGIKVGRVWLLPSRSLTKINSVKPGRKMPLPKQLKDDAVWNSLKWSQPIADHSLRATLGLLGGLYALNFLSYVSKKGWALAKQHSAICMAVKYTARTTGVVGVFSAAAGMGSTSLQAKFANEQIDAHNGNEAAVKAWTQYRDAANVSFWVAFYAGFQSVFESSPGVFADYCGIHSSDLNLALGCGGAVASFMKGWVAEPTEKEDLADLRRRAAGGGGEV